MKWKKVVFVLLSLMALGFISTLLYVGIIFGFDRALILFSAYHFVAILYGMLYITLFFILSRLIWFSFSSNTKKIYKKNKIRFTGIILSCFTFLYLGGWMMNHYGFDYKFQIMSVIGNLGIILFTLSLISILLEPSIGKRVILYSSGFVLASSITLAFLISQPGNPGEQSRKETLKSLPYLKWVPAEKTIEKSGVVLYNREKAFKGINIFHSQKSSTAYLMGMSGDILHTWSTKKNNEEKLPLAHIELCKNGDLIACVYRKFLFKLDWDSNIKWINEIRSHHDIAVDDNDDIYTLSHDYAVVFRSILPLPISNEYIVILSKEGEIKKKISLYKILKKEIPDDRFKKIGLWLISPKEFVIRIEKLLKPPVDIFGRTHDIIHSNTVEIINKDINNIFKKGKVLFCIRHLNLIGVIDPEEEKLVWSWGENDLDWPHHPTLLDNGNILIFDNGTHRQYSRVIELNPSNEKIVWQYLATPPESFFSAERGANQRLPNGNTLITESVKGRIFEITSAGEIVWEFYNPEIDSKRKKRASIYRMMRITDQENNSYLKNLMDRIE